ncbi:glucosamine-6-phosphate deaminase [Microbacterium sp. APC 3898]|uniref:Glucosamine-6-phosphate deaminase n=1 Tax=Planococcus notacanthi TaxID=3035188 RepID=A0ABT7ZN65_9BACL|nr:MULTISPECIES: glucosamine-6-phosphate deaminase [Terrabacteria group]MDN3428613.1 glucosamine-6-phosphate deaminase [Planococcus sp. APC 4016]MDN3498679.1 glucosamine-6-phosphate deaminase [Microbacterium sp. APC 3898]
MKLIRVENYEEMSSKAAQLVEQQIRDNPRSVLGLATGSTPLGLYEKLIEGVRERGISYRDVQTFNLDEYRGLSGEHSNSYRHFMNDKLFQSIDIQLKNTYVPNGKALPVEEECRRYEALIDELGPPHLQILGMGTNGHIGFNEPGTPETSRTHCVKLEQSTRNSNARFFSDRDEVPTHAITMGIESILKSEKVLLLASGKKKAQAVKRFLEGRVSKDFPASFLWKHSDVTLIVDREAYGLVKAEEE